jgi:Rho GTPase-activating protein RGD1
LLITNICSDSTQVDFRNPAAFHHDIASVTTLLKHFFRDLPDPLLTSSGYAQFIAAAKIDDDNVRRDSLHAAINDLPDPNYATLRILALHLQRVASHSDKNRMTAHNLAICLGPTLMGQNSQPGSAAPGPVNVGTELQDAGWQAMVIETIVGNALQIFLEDE